MDLQAVLFLPVQEANEGAIKTANQIETSWQKESLNMCKARTIEPHEMKYIDFVDHVSNSGVSRWDV